MPVQTNDRKAASFTLAKDQPATAKEIRHRCRQLADIADKLDSGEIPLAVGLSDIRHHTAQLAGLAGGADLALEPSSVPVAALNGAGGTK